MESLDKLLFASADLVSPQPGLTERTMARIGLTVIRRNLIIAMVGVVAAIALLAWRAHLGVILGYLVTKWSLITKHPGVFFQAIGESIPWPLVLAALALGLGLVFIGRLRSVGALVRASVLVSFLAYLLSGSAAILAYSTTSSTPGPAQEKLRLIVNGIGKPELTISGRTYQFSGNTRLSDDQLQAFAEQQRLVSIAQSLSTSSKVSYTVADYMAFGRVVSWDGKTLIASYGPTNFESGTPTGAVSAITVYADNGKRVSSLGVLRKGDLIAFAVQNGQVALLAKLHHPLSEYPVPMFDMESNVAHRSDQRCFNNLADRCPNLPFAYELLDVPGFDAPGNSQLKEVYGRISSLSVSTVTLETSSGAQWVFNLGSVIADANRLDLNIRVGDHLRVELWQPLDALSARVISDPTLNGPYSPPTPGAPQIKRVQLALRQPWHYGLDASKY